MGVSYKSFNAAVQKVRRELDAMGIPTEDVAGVDVWLVDGLFGRLGELITKGLLVAADPRTNGYCYEGGIWILSTRLPAGPLVDVIRHEYGHAVADRHPAVFSSRKFRCAFGAEYEDGLSCAERQGDASCVSVYARTNVQEDFAETFMLYLKHGGVLPRRFAGNKDIARKWEAVAWCVDGLNARRRKVPSKRRVAIAE